MIESMKKFSMLVYHAEYQHFLEELRKLGVLHVEMGEGRVGQVRESQDVKAEKVAAARESFSTGVPR